MKKRTIHQLAQWIHVDKLLTPPLRELLFAPEPA